jgi:hypothetical protein
MLHYDEAYEALDAQSLITNPRFTPFFPGNFGVRAALCIGCSLLCGRFRENRSACVGGYDGRCLDVGRDVQIGARIAPQAGRTMGDVGADDVVLACSSQPPGLARQFLCPGRNPVGGLALEACRTNHGWHWMRAGITLGLLAYTYFASAAWIGYAGLLLGMCYAFGQSDVVV